MGHENVTMSLERINNIGTSLQANIQQQNLHIPSMLTTPLVLNERSWLNFSAFSNCRRTNKGSMRKLRTGADLNIISFQHTILDISTALLVSHRRGLLKLRHPENVWL